MTTSDLSDVSAIAGRVHIDYPEDDEIFAERLALYPNGCFTLRSGGHAVGYVISHPWHFLKPPGLNEFLKEIPRAATTYYIHDLALLPEARKSRTASAMIETLAAHAKDQHDANMSLVAVNNSVRFWERHRFKIVREPSLDAKLKSYDGNARFMVREIDP
ncbi:GNAT family N-acetyltransferase [Bradyrhizobium erythrophlei]|uniref:GNAT family N-acetyltransferase n=1 Tax=Bradyrhizobium erythrophlei TaxID=1437360 RepID=UPI0035F02B25